MDIAETAKVLNDLYAQQYKDNLAANEANRRLADEKVSYTNEARGTYYSGIPTWERAQNAITYADKANDINKSYADTQTNLWNTIQDYVDQINAYNEAAGAATMSIPTGNSPVTSAPFTINGVNYTYVNGKLTRV
jgi:hypothetical protein